MENKKLRKGIIYCIICNITGEKYYGSTMRTIAKRMNQHRHLPSNTCRSRIIIERGDYRVEIIKEVWVIYKDDLSKIENEYIQNNQCINYRNKFNLTKEEKKERAKEITRKNNEKWAKIFSEANKIFEEKKQEKASN